MVVLFLTSRRQAVVLDITSQLKPATEDPLGQNQERLLGYLRTNQNTLAQEILEKLIPKSETNYLEQRARLLLKLGDFPDFIRDFIIQGQSKDLGELVLDLALRQKKIKTAKQLIKTYEFTPSKEARELLLADECLMAFACRLEANRSTIAREIVLADDLKRRHICNTGLAYWWNQLQLTQIETDPKYLSVLLCRTLDSHQTMKAGIVQRIQRDLATLKLAHPQYLELLGIIFDFRFSVDKGLDLKTKFLEIIRSKIFEQDDKDEIIGMLLSSASDFSLWLAQEWGENLNQNNYLVLIQGAAGKSKLCELWTQIPQNIKDTLSAEDLFAEVLKSQQTDSSINDFKATGHKIPLNINGLSLNQYALQVRNNPLSLNTTSGLNSDERKLIGRALIQQGETVADILEALSLE